MECAAPDKIIERGAVWQKFGGQSISQAMQSWENANFSYTPRAIDAYDGSALAAQKMAIQGEDAASQTVSTSEDGKGDLMKQVNVVTDKLRLPSTFITDTQQQLARLDKLPPDWNLSYSLQLLKQLQTLWPEEAKPLTMQWQQKFNAAALPVDAMNSWYQGMMTLQQLSHRLSSLDEQKGKYITVSELKSVVFSTIQSFNQTIPAEEQLRRLSQHPAGDALPEAEKTQLELRLKQLATRYAQIKQDSSAQ
ncbi:hypothetical protein WP8W18C04_30840 [Enterobacter cloacae]|nr:hypothetical protein WP8W18C04_30840 [Enterobacter cloacae]